MPAVFHQNVEDSPAQVFAMHSEDRNLRAVNVARDHRSFRGVTPASTVALAWMCAVAIAALVGASCSGGEATDPPQTRRQDPPHLVIDKSIGAVRLNMTPIEVEERYGEPSRVDVMPEYFPVGTRYEGKKLTRALYSVHAGALRVDYVANKVKVIETSSRYYRSASGIGVGALVPSDRCVRLDEVGHIGPPGCKNTWRGFRFESECLNAWLTSTRDTAMTMLIMHRGRRIEKVRIGDPDVILPCF
jgi:hypothetical protein